MEAHIFSFVVGRAFVTDVEKLRIHSQSKSLNAMKVMGFFSELTEVCFSCVLSDYVIILYPTLY